MKKLLTFMLALFATTCLWAGNTITYRASSQLPETTVNNSAGLHTNAFNVSISSHTFSNGQGSITFSGEVTSIGNYAFRQCSELTSITIPNSVTAIGNYAFRQCSGLTSITIPNAVTSIGVGAFYNCSGLTSCTIPNGVTSIGREAFMSCFGLISITIPGSVTSIENNTFTACSSLTSVTIGNGVTSIGDYVFSSCSSLTSISIPNSVTSIGQSAFQGIPVVFYTGNATGSPWGASRVCAAEDTYFYYYDTRKTQLAKCKPNVSGAVIIPNGVTSIGEYAFSRCSSLTSITIPSSVTSIGNFAFYNCNGLTSLTVPNSVTSIGQSAFQGIPVVFYTGNAAGSPWGTTVYGAEDTYFYYWDAEKTQLAKCKPNVSGAVIIPNGVTSIGRDAFYNCDGLTSITIPSSVTSIRESAFGSCSGLTSITIPNGVTRIYSGTFGYCTGLTSVSIPNSVTEIEEGAFENCSSLTSITIPNSVTKIKYDAFRDCSSLQSVTIGNSLTNIGSNAFRDCAAISNIYCAATTPPTCPDDDVFWNVGQFNTTLHVPATSLNSYRVAIGWRYFQNIVGDYTGGGTTGGGGTGDGGGTGGGTTENQPLQYDATTNKTVSHTNTDATLTVNGDYTLTDNIAIVSISSNNDILELYIYIAALTSRGTIPDGTYIIGQPNGARKSTGYSADDGPRPCYYATFSGNSYTNFWFMVSGSITVSNNGTKFVVNAQNSNNVSINYTYTGSTGGGGGTGGGTGGDTSIQNMWIVGECATANWTPGASKQMRMTSPGIFEVDETMTGTWCTFVYSIDNCTATNTDWDVVNSHRLGSNPSGEVLYDGVPTSITGINGDYGFQVPSPGAYHFTVNLNTMTVTATQAGNSGNTSVQNMWIIGECATANWTPGASKKMRLTSPGIFEVDETMTGTWCAFVYSIDNCTASTTDWDIVNSHRLGSDPSGEVLYNGIPTSITGINGDYCFQVPSPGTYHFTVNLNTMTATARLAGTALENVSTVSGTQKIIENNQVFILRNGKRYTLQGQEVK